MNIQLETFFKKLLYAKKQFFVGGVLLFYSELSLGDFSFFVAGGGGVTGPGQFVVSENKVTFPGYTGQPSGSCPTTNLGSTAKDLCYAVKNSAETTGCLVAPKLYLKKELYDGSYIQGGTGKSIFVSCPLMIFNPSKSTLYLQCVYSSTAEIKYSDLKNTGCEYH